MKILKYVAVLASAMLVSLTYAADAQSNDPVKVSVKNDNGAVSVSISVDVKNPTVSCEEALKDVLKKALAAVGADSLNGKAISAAMVAINAALADRNAPALGPVEVSFVVKNKVEELVNVAEVAANVTIAGEKYQANTETRYNPAHADCGHGRQRFGSGSERYGNHNAGYLCRRCERHGKRLGWQHPVG